MRTIKYIFALGIVLAAAALLAQQTTNNPVSTNGLPPIIVRTNVVRTIQPKPVNLTPAQVTTFVNYAQALGMTSSVPITASNIISASIRQTGKSNFIFYLRIK